MKIFFVANTAWSIFNFRYGLLKALLARGFNVVVLAPYDKHSAALRSMGCDVIDLPISAKGVNPLCDLALIWNMFLLYKKHNPQIVFHYTIKPNIFGSLAAFLANIPSVAVTTGLGYTFINDNWVAKVARWLYRLAFRYPLEVWFLNEDDRQVFVEHELVPHSKTFLLDSEGINTSCFEPREKLVVSSKVKFLLIARMLWDKGVGEFVDAARKVRIQYPDAVFQLLGACDVENPSAITRAQLAEWEYEGVVEYLGVAEDVRQMISEADCVVLPSYREGVPRTLMEAASMGKPLIASDVPGCREVIKNTVTGWLCPVRNSLKLSDCFIDFLKMTMSEREAMGLAGRAYMIERFDEKKVISQYMDTLARYGVIGSAQVSNGERES